MNRYYVPFKPEHLKEMGMRKRELAHHPKIHVDQGKLIEAQAGVAYTAYCDGKIIGIIGIVSPWEGLGTAWAVMGEGVDRHWLWIHKQAKKIIREAIDKKMFRRIQATCEAGFPEAARWLERLGFQFEVPLPNYGPNGEDHYQYSMVIK